MTGVRVGPIRSFQEKIERERLGFPGDPSNRHRKLMRPTVRQAGVRGGGESETCESVRSPEETIAILRAEK
jgi:hypothetical protein